MSKVETGLKSLGLVRLFACRLSTLCVVQLKASKTNVKIQNLWSDLPSKTAALSTSFHLDWSDDEGSCDCEANVQ